jgi:hypothetical protein
VVESHDERVSQPFLDAALLAAVLLQPSGDEAELQVRAIRLASIEEQLLERHRLRPRDDVAALDSLVP